MVEKPANDDLRQHFDELAWMREIKHENEIAARLDERERDMRDPYDEPVPQTSPAPQPTPTPPETLEQSAEMDTILSGLLIARVVEQQSSAQGEDLYDKVKRHQETRSAETPGTTKQLQHDPSEDRRW